MGQVEGRPLEAVDGASLAEVNDTYGFGYLPGHLEETSLAATLPSAQPNSKIQSVEGKVGLNPETSLLGTSNSPWFKVPFGLV